MTITIEKKYYSLDGSKQQYEPIDPDMKKRYPNYAVLATDKQWIVYCDSASTHIIAELPQGHKYHFRALFDGSKNDRTTGESFIFKIEDRHGNWVKYEYNQQPINHRVGLLKRINSNDGRAINIGYNSKGFISTATANGRQWRYSYATRDSLTAKRQELSKVTLPGGRSWTISDAVAFTYDDLAEDCPTRLDDLVVKSPSGASVRYKFHVIVNGRYRTHNKIKIYGSTRKNPGTPGDNIVCGRVEFGDEDGPVDASRNPNPRVNFTVAVTESR